ncbi:phosphopantetheine-binding protein [Pseudomonas aeruginosa]|nr:phosphopantetheine-binding protein [Pseudomonas aeruginosa]
MTAHGKLDRAALLRRLEEPLERCASALDPDQRGCARLWSELLGCEVGAADQDFFLCGGNSLLALQLVALCQSAGAGANPGLADLQANSRLDQFSRLLRSHGRRRSVCWNGRRRRAAAGAVEERGMNVGLRGGALPLVPRAPGGGRRLAPPVPLERDRLRHQPMPDEAAQSLRVDLSPWSCGMVFSELLGADLTRFGLCYLAPAEVPGIRPDAPGAAPARRVPVARQPGGQRRGRFRTGRPRAARGEPGAGSRPLRRRKHAHRSAAATPAFPVRARPAATVPRALRGVRAGASGCITWSPTPTTPACCWPAWRRAQRRPTTEAAAPEFGFLQQQWRLERQLRERRTRLEDYWSERGEAFRELAEPATGRARQPLRGFPLGCHARGGEAALLTRLACAWLSPWPARRHRQVLALTPVSLRSRRARRFPVAG